MPTISENIELIQHRIEALANQNHRSNEEIMLLAVTKTRSPAEIRQAYDTGLRNFGENYLQEAIEKIEQLENLDICWHFIGTIQSNKTRIIAEHFDWVHSVDRFKTAQRLSSQRPDNKSPLNCCIQVNISGEESKGGVAPENVTSLALAINKLANINLRGLMVLPLATDNPEIQQQSFEKTAQLFESIRVQLPQLDSLSMGMTGDMDTAIAAGSTIVRIGTAIFGPRNHSDKTRGQQ